MLIPRLQPLSTALVLLAIVGTRAHAQKFLSNVHIKHSENASTYRVDYESEGVTNPGTKALDGRGDENRFKVERDADGALLRVTGGKTVWSVGPATEEWTQPDPKAFTTVYAKTDGARIRETTLASVPQNGAQTMVSRSIYLGPRTRTGEGRILEQGEITREEYTVPAPGMGVLTKGTEVDGRFISTLRSTRLRYLDEASHTIHRLISESRSDASSEWKTDSDVLTETRKIGSNMEKVREVFWPDGEALTRVWEYYAPGDVTHSDGSVADRQRIKSQRNSDGTVITYQYPAKGWIRESRYPDGSIIRVTENHPKTDDDSGVRTKVETVDGREVDHQESSYLKTVTSRPGQPDQTKIEEFVPRGQPFGGSSKRTIFPDGTITTWLRTMLPDGGTRVVIENGRGDGERVVDGTRQTTVYSKDSNVLSETTERIP